MIRQRTIKRAVSVKGIGTHTGSEIKLTLRPAPVGSGIVFRRLVHGEQDSSDQRNELIDIPATPDNIGNTQMASVLVHGQTSISTIEHLMAALAGLGVDNLFVEVDGPEIPILDGSAIGFVLLIQSVGLEEQTAAKRFLRITKPIEVAGEHSWAKLLPFNGCKLSFQADFSHPFLKKLPSLAKIDLGRQSFIQELSRARTFGLLSDYDKLRAMNLARGASLENVIVIDQDRVLNKGGLRYPNECARHKLLDAMGDLYQLGMAIIGEFRGYRSGHALNNQLTRAVVAHPECWELLEASESNSRESTIQLASWVFGANSSAAAVEG